MIRTAAGTEIIAKAIRLACRAPSLHNSQPWRWIVGHRRRTVLEVANAAPAGSPTELAGSPSSSWTSTCQPPAGDVPAVAMSPPRLISTPLPVAD